MLELIDKKIIVENNFTTHFILSNCKILSNISMSYSLCYFGLELSKIILITLLSDDFSYCKIMEVIFFVTTLFSI